MSDGRMVYAFRYSTPSLIQLIILNSCKHAVHILFIIYILIYVPADIRNSVSHIIVVDVSY